MFSTEVVERIAVSGEPALDGRHHVTPVLVVAVESFSNQGSHVGSPIGGVTGGGCFGRESAAHNSMYAAGAPVKDMDWRFPVEEVGGAAQEEVAHLATFAGL
jgi:hypothetical protein